MHLAWAAAHLLNHPWPTLQAQAKKDHAAMHLRTLGRATTLTRKHGGGEKREEGSTGSTEDVCFLLFQSLVHVCCEQRLHGY